MDDANCCAWHQHPSKPRSCYHSRAAEANQCCVNDVLVDALHPHPSAEAESEDIYLKESDNLLPSREKGLVSSPLTGED